MSIRDEFGRRAADDELCAEVRQAVEDGDEDALRRLGFGGFGGYVQRLSEIMSDSVTDGLDLSADDFGAIMGEVASPARYAHHLVNEAGTAIQSARDKPLGIHIKPAEPDFDDDALCGTVGKAASMDTPEQTVKTLADGLGYAVKKAGNDFIKLNAEQRSKAGFEVGVKRSGDSKCCDWCAARIGSWAIANAPDDVFGCHANCSCAVEYTSSTGAKTSARGANLNRLGAGAFTEIEYQPPHVLNREEAREKGGFDEPKRLTKNPVESQPHRLTGGANGGIINNNNSTDESELGKFKQHISEDTRMDSDYYNAVKERFSHGSNDAKMLFNKYVNADYVADSQFEGTPHYDPKTQKISIHYLADMQNSRGAGVTYFHEHGHLIDDLAGNLSENDEFYELLRQDKSNYVREIIRHQEKPDLITAYRELEKELSDFSSQSAVSDMFNGLSAGVINGCAVHDKNYWTKKSVQHEAFAHMFECQFDRDRYAQMKKYFPNSLEYFEKMIRRAAK